MQTFLALYSYARLNGFTKTLKNTIIDFALVPSSAQITEDCVSTISGVAARNVHVHCFFCLCKIHFLLHMMKDLVLFGNHVLTRNDKTSFVCDNLFP